MVNKNKKKYIFSKSPHKGNIAPNISKYNLSEVMNPRTHFKNRQFVRCRISGKHARWKLLLLEFFSDNYFIIWYLKNTFHYSSCFYNKINKCQTANTRQDIQQSNHWNGCKKTLLVLLNLTFNFINSILYFVPFLIIFDWFHFKNVSDRQIF